MNDIDEYYMHEIDLDSDLKKKKKKRNNNNNNNNIDTKNNRKTIAKIVSHDKDDSDGYDRYDDNVVNTSFDPTINVATLDPTDNVADVSSSVLAAAAAAGSAIAGAGVVGDANRPRLNKRVTLDTDKLLHQDKGLNFLIKNGSKRIRISRKNKTIDNLTNITQFYQLWAHNLYPKAKFKDFLLMTEKLGNQMEIKQYRRDLYIDELENNIDLDKYDKNVHKKVGVEIEDNGGNDDDHVAVGETLLEELKELGTTISIGEELQEKCSDLIYTRIIRHIGAESFIGVDIPQKFEDIIKELLTIDSIEPDIKNDMFLYMVKALPSVYSESFVKFDSLNRFRDHLLFNEPEEEEVPEDYPVEEDIIDNNQHVTSGNVGGGDENGDGDEDEEMALMREFGV